jgi:hypothetical protein
MNARIFSWSPKASLAGFLFGFDAVVTAPLPTSDRKKILGDHTPTDVTFKPKLSFIYTRPGPWRRDASRR